MTSSTTPAAAAGSWQLGDITVNRLGLGAMRLPQTGPAFTAGPPRDRAQAIAVVRRAVELGVNHIDTAAFYFCALRSANELVHTALGADAEHVLVATKVGPTRDRDGEWGESSRPEELRGQVEENLRQLGRDHLDLVYLRREYGMDSVAAHFSALAELRTAGLIRHLGLSAIKPEHLAEASAIAPVVSVQNGFSLTARRHDPLLAACAEQGIAFVPFFAIAGPGREDGATDAVPAAVEAVATARGVTSAQVLLAWSLAQGPHVLAIPGTGDPAHLEDNVAAAAISLSPAELSTLDAAGD